MVFAQVIASRRFLNIETILESGQRCNSFGKKIHDWGGQNVSWVLFNQRKHLFLENCDGQSLHFWIRCRRRNVVDSKILWRSLFGNKAVKLSEWNKKTNNKGWKIEWNRKKLIRIMIRSQLVNFRISLIYNFIENI